VLQIVSSPLRNAVPRSVQRGFRFAASGPARAIGRTLARGARLAPPAVDWHLSTGPIVANGIGWLHLDGPGAELELLGSRLDGDDSVLVEIHREQLDVAQQAT
jgi:hypothetical protein